MEFLDSSVFYLPIALDRKIERTLNGQSCSNGIKGCKFMPYDESYKWIKCKCAMWLKTGETLDAHLAAYT